MKSQSQKLSCNALAEIAIPNLNMQYQKLNCHAFAEIAIEWLENSKKFKIKSCLKVKIRFR
jgi:hypothetical protein